VPQAPPPMIANRLIVSRLNPRSRPRWCGGIERPTWPKRRVKTIYEAEAKPLQPAQAIIAPLSVHNAGGGATKRSPAFPASAARRRRN